jgi:eukaryotic-like serine/threonine-protein kinase
MGIELVAGAMIARRYRLDRLIGEGGMGAVWAATHSVTRRAVAMKFVRGPVHLKPDLRRRFLREARAASAVNHPNVVQIHDVFELDDDTPVMVMDLLEGETLARRANRERKLSLEDAAAVLLPVVSAVGTAHSRGIVHRDLKPENVFLARTEDGETVVKVLDFGIAKLTIEPGDSDEGLVTGTGTALGTPCYMAPEQCFGEKSIDHRADVWALGVMFYELLAGCRPIEGDSVGHVVKTMMTTSITPLEVLVPVPDDVSALVRRMLSREADGRPSDLREVQELLARYSVQKVRNFGAPASLPVPSLEREAADRRSSDPAVSPEIHASDETPPTDESDDTDANQRGAERTFISGELRRSTTTGAHAVAGPKQQSGRIWLVGAVAVVGLIGAVVLTQRPSVAPQDEPRATSAGAMRSAPKPELAPSPEPAMLASPPTQTASASEPAPAASAPIPLASSAAAIKRATPGSKTVSKPAGAAKPPPKKSGSELFDDRK